MTYQVRVTHNIDTHAEQFRVNRAGHGPRGV